MQGIFRLNRRAMLAGTTATGAGALLGGLAAPVAAAAPKLGNAKPQHYRFTLGGFEITTILDGTRAGDGPHPTFGADQTPETVEKLLTENFLPMGRFVNGFTPTVVNTGEKLVLFDTGLGAGGREGGLGQLVSRLAAAGIEAAQIDTVVLTHMHPDHIGGLMEAGAAAFPNAAYVTGSTEYDFWAAPDRMTGPTERVAKMVAANVTPLAARTSFVKPGDSVAPGIEAVAAFGHTPGHMAFHIESEGKRLMLTADAVNHYVVSLQRPDWHVAFDADKAAAAATRKSLLGQIAADRIPFIGYHMPFPSVGYLEPLGDGFRFVPAAYQLDL